LKVTRFSKEHSQDWDNFISVSQNGTLFHERKFLNYHPETRFKDHSLIFQNNKNFAAVLPAIETSSDGDKILISDRKSVV